MTTNTTSIISFPVVHNNGGKIFEFHCQPSAVHSSNLIKTIPPELERINKKLIELSRKSEGNFDSAVNSTICTTTSEDFHGESYQLALVLADKLARYQTGLETFKVYATGFFKGSKIKAVDYFKQKIKLILDDAQKLKKDNPSQKKIGIFFYPADNNENNQYDSDLRLLNELGVKSHSFKSLADVNDYVIKQVKDDSKPITLSKPRKPVFVVTAIALLLGITTIGISRQFDRNSSEVSETSVLPAGEAVDSQSRDENTEIPKNQDEIPTQPSLQDEKANFVDEKIILESDPNFPTIY